jgi:putative ATP-dependent endonuclease of OLD family
MGEGLRLSSLFMYEKLVFVEGPSDEDVLREWASVLGLNFSQTNVGFVTIGGSRNVKHFAAAKTTEFLNSRGVELWFVLDRDESTAEDTKKLQETLGPNCKIRILRAREIENYLAMPTLLSEYISRRLTQAGGDISMPKTQSVSVTEISQVIDECANDLRTFAFGKSLLRRVNNPIYISPGLTPSLDQRSILEAIKQSLTDGSASLVQRQKELEGMICNHTIEFDAAWSRDKLLVVPGTELLEAVLRRYKLAYKKRRDAKGIAALMEPRDIPHEIADILREIAPARE